MILFEPNEKKFLNNGLGRLTPLKCIETKKKSLNGWFIECDLPVKYKDLIHQDYILYVETKVKNGQPFRINNIDKTDRSIKVIANHVVFDSERYLLLDVRPMNLSSVSFLDWINKRTDTESPFTTTSNVSGTGTKYFIRRTLLDSLIETELLFGGSYDVDKFNISLKSVVGNDDGFSLAYGKNIQSASVIEDWSSVCTRIIPVGPDELMLPEKYIDSSIQYDNPYTRTITFDFDVEGLSDTDKMSTLREKAFLYLRDNSTPRVNYLVKSDVDQSLNIGDVIKTKHPLFEIRTEVLSYTYDTIRKHVLTLEFGNYSRDVKKVFDNIKETIQNANKKASGALIESKKQTELINNLNKNGLVYIDENEILILDKLHKDQAKEVWRFGLGGIGFSSNGYNGPFEYALTQDGHFNIDFIQANSITVNKLAADVGSSLDLSSNRSIKLMVDLLDSRIDEIDLSTIQFNLIKTGTVLNKEISSISLSAQVMQGAQDITSTIPALSFTWQRKSSDTVKDTTWNNAHKSMKTVTLTSSDIDTTASFQCTVTTATYTKYTGYETIVDETDIARLSLQFDSNLPLTQSYDKNTGEMSPSWNPLIVTPIIWDGVLDVPLSDCEISWKRMDGDLQAGEIIVDGLLKISNNKLSEVSNGMITYVCTVKYKTQSISNITTYVLVSNGADGESGKGIESNITEYYLSTSKSTQAGGSWTTTSPSWSAGKYLWSRSKITFSDKSVTYTGLNCDTTWEVINDLEIGGRNHILNSKSLILDKLNSEVGKNGEYGYIDVGKSYMDLPQGTMITISFDVEIKVNTANPTLTVYNGNQKGKKMFTGKNVYFTASVGTVIKERRYIVTNLIDRAEAEIQMQTNAIEFYTIYGTSNFFKITNLKLETGNKGTDYTLAPEDVEDQISNEVGNAEVRITESYNALVDITKKEIELSVQSLTTTVGNSVEQIVGLQNQIELTNEATSFIKTTTEELKDLVNGKADISTIKEWARFDGATLELGASNSPFKATLSTVELAFWQGNTKVAWINNNELHIANSVIMEILKVGNWQFRDEGKAGLTLRRL